MSSGDSIFYLEMCGRELFRPSEERRGFELVEVVPADAELNCRYYKEVGSKWEWTDRSMWPWQKWSQHVANRKLRTFVANLEGVEVGYVELEIQGGGDVELALLGLLPEMIGKGLGGVLLSEAVTRAWAFPGTTRVWLHTCNKDHENALRNYQARGFSLYKTETDN